MYLFSKSRHVLHQILHISVKGLFKEVKFNWKQPLLGNERFRTQLNYLYYAHELETFCVKAGTVTPSTSYIYTSVSLFWVQFSSVNPVVLVNPFGLLFLLSCWPTRLLALLRAVSSFWLIWINPPRAAWFSSPIGKGVNANSSSNSCELRLWGQHNRLIPLQWAFSLNSRLNFS